jgi:hypothetical protein
MLIAAAPYPTQVLTFWFAVGPVACIFALLIIVNVSRWYRNSKRGRPTR